jgi:hypothetical protein
MDIRGMGSTEMPLPPLNRPLPSGEGEEGTKSAPGDVNEEWEKYPPREDGREDELGEGEISTERLALDEAGLVGFEGARLLLPVLRLKYAPGLAEYCSEV